LYSSSPSRKTTSVLFVTPECAPLVKTGGLGDVSAALPPALRELGLDARVLLPGYPSVLAADPAAREAARIDVLGESARILESKLPSGVPLLILDAPRLYKRSGGPYQADDGEDWEDNARRFGVLSRAAAILGSSQSPLPWKADVVHCNDWQASLAPLYLRGMSGARAASVVTIHNLAFQGAFDLADVQDLELPPESLGMEGLEFYGRASFLKGGIVYADAITTVSPTYAREIQTQQLGFGLEGVLTMRRDRLFGVLNGIDTSAWNPETDPHIPAHYGVLTLERKAANKRALKERFGLGGDDTVPLLAAVTRVTQQKGVDLITHAMARLVQFPAQLILVGAGDRRMIDEFRHAASRFPGQVGVFEGFDEPLAHLVEAGADIFLMPSRFEPCGMNQMYSQRYGTPPVVNATGGLVDTVIDGETGFLLEAPTVDALVQGVGRAIEAYCDQGKWRRLQATGMRRNFGWAEAARSYSLIYEQVAGDMRASRQ
jgi:starch synthase